MVLNAPVLRPPYSYRADPTVPTFPDGHPIIVFDGHCVLCSGFAQFVIRHDPRAHFRFVAAQSPLGQALYRHYGLETQDLKTNLLIQDGRVWVKADGTLKMCEGLGFPWSLLRVLRILPPSLLDRGYELLATNRLKWFGRHDACFAPTPDIKARFL